MRRRREAAEAKDAQVRAVLAELLEAAENLSRDLERLRVALRKVDRRDRNS